MYETSNFLNSLEKMLLQGLNTWWYGRGIHRLSLPRKVRYPTRTPYFVVVTKFSPQDGNFLAFREKGLIKQVFEGNSETKFVHSLNWITIQAGLNKCFQYLSAAKNCREILFNTIRNSFTFKNLTEARQERVLPTLVNAWDTFIFLIGGL